VFLWRFFSNFTALKARSAVHEVTGKAEKTFRRVFMFENRAGIISRLAEESVVLS
jgi:hypothetical protein